MSIVLEGKIDDVQPTSLSGVWRFMKDQVSHLNFSFSKVATEISNDLFNTVSFLPQVVDTPQISDGIANDAKPMLKLPTAVHELVGLYQGNFQVASAEGPLNITEEFFIFAFYSRGNTINSVDNDWWIDEYNSLPSPPLFAMSVKKLFETNLLNGNDVNIQDIRCFYGFGKNQFGIFSVVMMLNEKTNNFCLEKKYMLSKYPVGRRAKVVSATDPVISTIDSSVAVAKRRRIESSKVRPSVTEYLTSDYETVHEKVYMAPVNAPDVSSDDDKSYVEGQFDVESFEIYEGDIFNGIRHGMGICLRPDGTLYEGSWINGKETGPGKLMYSDRKVIYSGDFLDGLFNGIGVYCFDNGDLYTGEWKESLRHGKGEYVFKNGCRYVGEWRENKRHGRGSFYWPDGSTYEGEFEQDLRHGRGQLDLKDCFRYDGYWLSNFFEGRGIGIFSGGQEYHGSYKQGCREGRGSIAFAEGAVYEGRFKDDRIEGMGTIKVNRTLTGGMDGETYLPINIQADIKRIHLRAGFGDEGR